MDDNEIVIEATSKDRADYAVELLLASDALVNGCRSLLGEDLEVLPEEAPDASNVDEHRRLLQRSQGQTSSLEHAAVVAAKVSHRRKYQYALFKMRLSYRLCSVDVIDLDPSHWCLERAVFDHAAHHVSLAYAIQAAYSAIEELGLEIRASADEPSVVDGRWNPRVLEDLRHRLRRSGIDLSESAIWHRRGPPSAVERRFSPPPGCRAPWTYRNIRDAEISIEDAVLYASRIRSRVATHRLPKIAASLTHYDAANVQYLARRLLLASVGRWRWASVACEEQRDR